MPYLIDRERALYAADVVAIVAGTRRGERSEVTLRDNSLHRTASRVKTLVEAERTYLEMDDRRSQGATWRRKR
jgi:hypothetical protein